MYNLCALFIAIAFETCVVYARIWLLLGPRFKFPFCSLFPRPPTLCLRCTCVLGDAFSLAAGRNLRLHGGRGRRGESPEWGGSPEGERPRSREGALRREPWEWRESPEGESPELVAGREPEGRRATSREGASG